MPVNVLPSAVITRTFSVDARNYLVHGPMNDMEMRKGVSDCQHKAGATCPYERDARDFRRLLDLHWCCERNVPIVDNFLCRKVLAAQESLGNGSVIRGILRTGP